VVSMEGEGHLAIIGPAVRVGVKPKGHQNSHGGWGRVFTFDFLRGGN